MKTDSARETAETNVLAKTIRCLAGSGWLCSVLVLVLRPRPPSDLGCLQELHVIASFFHAYFCDLHKCTMLASVFRAARLGRRRTPVLAGGRGSEEADAHAAGDRRRAVRAHRVEGSLLRDGGGPLLLSGHHCSETRTTTPTPCHRPGRCIRKAHKVPYNFRGSPTVTMVAPIQVKRE